MRWIAAILIVAQVLAPASALAQVRSTAPQPPAVDAKGPPPSTAPKGPERRLALIIGNNNYKNAPLLNPINDARLVAETLKNLGFEVILRENLNLRDFKAVMRQFASRMENEDGAALLYYAGHGVQIEGRNFLLPVDVSTGDEYEVRDESVDLEETLMSRLPRARKRERIIVLDACRDNPFRAAKQTGRGIMARGFAQMGSDEKGTLIVYSTSPGHVAEDGTGKNSIFSQHFAAEIQKEGVEVGQALRTVFNQVNTATKGRQTPWYNSSLLGDFYFRPIDQKAEEERRKKEMQQQIEAAVKAAKEDTKREESARIEATIAARLAEREREQKERERQYNAQIAEMKALLERREKDVETARIQVASAARTRDEQLAALAAAEAERKRLERERASAPPTVVTATVPSAPAVPPAPPKESAADNAKKQAEAEQLAKEKRAEAEQLAKQKRERDAMAAAVSAERNRLLKLEAQLRADEEKAARIEADRQAKAAAELAQREASEKAANEKAERDQRALAEAQRKAAERERFAQAEAQRKAEAQAKREEAARLARINAEKIRALEDQARMNAERQRAADEALALKKKQQDEALALKKKQLDEALALKQEQPAAGSGTVDAQARLADQNFKRAKEDADRAVREAEASERLAKIEEDVRRKAALELEMLNRKASLPPELAALMISEPQKTVVTGTSGDFYVRGVRLPADVAVRQPAGGVPANCAAFVGAWGNGRWNGERSAEVWVESVEADCRGRAIYARGGLGLRGEPATFMRGVAKISGDSLTLDLDNVRIELNRRGDRADGRWSSGTATATAQFERIPPVPDRSVPMFANEAVDFGGKPSRVISTSQISSGITRGETMLPLPMAVPGVDTLTTLQVEAFLKKNPDAVLVDAMSTAAHRTLPGAYWMPELGQVMIGQKERSQIETTLRQAMGGDPSRPIIVFERSSTYGWLGYHGVLRLLGMGYSNIYWYRGGLDAWHDAQFALAQAEVWARAR